MLGQDLTQLFNTDLGDREPEFQRWLREMSRARGRNLARDLADYDLRGDWLAGAGRDARGHGSDRFKKPNHPTFSQESIYSRPGVSSGGRWVETDTGWAFEASPQNLRFRSPERLREYFRMFEPESAVILPRTRD